MAADALMESLVAGFIPEAEELGQRVTQGLLRAETAKGDRTVLQDVYADLARALHTWKGSAATIGLTDLADHMHRLEDVLAPLTRERIPLTPELVDGFLGAVDQALQWLRARVEGATPLPPLDPLAVGTSVAPVTAEASPTRGQPTAPADDTPEPGLGGWRVPPEAITRLMIEVERLREVRLRLEERHRELRHLMGELSHPTLQTVAAEISAGLNNTDHALELDCAETGDVVDTLEDHLRAICTLPLDTVVAPLQRLVRDLCRQLGKHARLSVVGGQTALDRRLLDALRGPLVQLIRNAIDHGVEPPTQREQAGKHQEGALVLRAEQVGNLVVVEFSDDGAGMDLDAICATAVSTGLMTREQAAAAVPAQLHSLVFHSGFSTRKEITGTSGRGVGLDVVEQHLRQVGGNVEVHSVRGQGTRFTLHIPAELGSSPLMILRLGEHVMAVPMQSVRAVVRARRERIQVGNHKLFLTHGDHAMPLDDLGARLGLRQGLVPADGQPLLVVNSQGTERALLVDGLVGERETLVRPLPDEIKGLPAYQGVAVLARGEPVLVLRPAWLITEPETSATPSSSRCVLVVDDSLTSRAMHRAVLESGGYVVHTAGTAS